MRIGFKHYMANHNYRLIKWLLIIAMSISYVTGYAGDADQNITEQRRAELHNLLIQDCGSCHGMTMKGGLGPALTPDVLKNKSRHMIEVTILQGRPGTPMPPWQSILSKEEVRWLVDVLYAGVTR